MNPVRKLIYRRRRGAALIISMIFVLIFSALAVSVAGMVGANVQIADNCRQVSRALESAHSGLEVIRYYLSDINISGDVQPADRLETVAAILQSNLATAGVTNITADYDAATATIAIAGTQANTSVVLDSQSSQTFSAVISQLDVDTLQVDITGAGRKLSRVVRVEFLFLTTSHNVFDFGIATKGPLQMSGNIDVEGLNESIEADVYIESENDDDALSMIGKSAIAGNVSIVNADANPNVSNSSSIGGETGQDAIDNHVTIGVPPADFPVPDPTAFEDYVENTLDPNTDTTTNLTLENIRIPAGTNPHFSGNVIIRGIMFIESPNIVKFTGNTNITGIIVADGDLDFPSEENQIEFRGSVDSSSVSELPMGFGDLRQETGTFLLAPGFSVSFGGDFETINGAIAASGIAFFGNAGGTINGSVVNYADTPMTLNGNTDLLFNRSGLTEVPAGFEPQQVIEFQPGSYSEIAM